MKTLLTLVAAIGLTAALVPTQAAAQNMDMSWAIRQQNQLQMQGDARARALAQWYYNYMLMLRRQGYTGPSLATGFDANTLQQSNRRLQEAYDRYNRSSAINSERRSNSASDYDMRAIRGCQVGVDANGNRYYFCP